VSNVDNKTGSNVAATAADEADEAEPGFYLMYDFVNDELEISFDSNEDTVTSVGGNEFDKLAPFEDISFWRGDKTGLLIGVTLHHASNHLKQSQLLRGRIKAQVYRGEPHMVLPIPDDVNTGDGSAE
jgi:hypothetical protein